MANTPVTAMGPLEFTDGGEQFVIPLSALYFDSGTNQLKTDSPLYAKHKATIDAWLSYLQDNGTVTPAPQPPPAAAMVIAAADSGSSGNDISIAFANVRVDPNTHDTIFDATLTQTDTYPGLTPDTVKDVIGTSAGGGSRPGLVFVSSGGAPTQPANGSTPLTGGPPFTADLSDGVGGTAFSVRSKSDDADAADTTVTISAAADPGDPGTFTLTATWTKQVTGIQAADLETSFAYEITVVAPPAGQLLPPSPGTVALRGGSDLTGPSKASVTVSAQ